jgi:2-phosphosulfolactate phosphatase
MTSDQRATPTPADINRNRRPTSIATGGRHQSESPADFIGIRIERLYAASLVTAEATVRSLLSGSPDQVSLVAMGDNGLKRTDEDELCAIHIRNRLEGRPGDADAIRRLILAGGEVGRFHDTARPYLHPEDVDIALDIDRYDFAVRVDFEDGRPVARIETPAVTMPKSAT